MDAPPYVKSKVSRDAINSVLVENIRRHNVQVLLNQVKRRVMKTYIRPLSVGEFRSLRRAQMKSDLAA